MAATWLIGLTGSQLAPGFYLVIAAALAIASLLWMKDRSREPLR